VITLYSLLCTHYSILTTLYSLLYTHYSLLYTHYSLLTTVLYNIIYIILCINILLSWFCILITCHSEIHVISIITLTLLQLKLMATLHQTQPTVQQLLSSSDYVGALDIISTAQEVLAKELTGIRSFKYAKSWFYLIRFHAMLKLLTLSMTSKPVGYISYQFCFAGILDHSCWS